VPLSLGGHPTSPLNLWPQPRNSAVATYNAETKDLLEQKLQALVCGNVTTLDAAQTAIAANWSAAYFEFINSSATAAPLFAASSG